jgi:hypothetical protein
MPTVRTCNRKPLEQDCLRLKTMVFFSRKEEDRFPKEVRISVGVK